MDPLNITVASLSLAKMCGTIGVQLGILIQATKDVETTITGLQGDIQDFKIVLDLLHETVSNQDVRDWIASTGRIETYWTSLEASLGDAKNTLNSLKTKTENINKSSRVFDMVRKQVRMKFAAEEIVTYRQQIARFKGTVQVVLNTTTIWHHASDKQVSEQVLPRLDETQTMIRELGLQLNDRMTALQALIQSQPTQASLANDSVLPQKIEYRALDNMRSCLRGAASVIVSASTVAGEDAFDDNATTHGSDFGDVFPSTLSDQTLSWIRDNAISEKIEQSGDQQEPPINIIPSFAELQLFEEPDYDQGLEWEMRTACLELGLQCLDDEQYQEAQKHLVNSIDDLSEDQILIKASQNELEFFMKATTGLSRALLNLKRWDELQAIYKKRLYVQSRKKDRDMEQVISDKLQLSRALYECSEYKESLLYCRSAEVEYRKLGPSGLGGRIDALRLLAQVHKQLGSEKESVRCETLAEYLLPSKLTRSLRQEVEWSKEAIETDVKAPKATLPGSENNASSSISSSLNVLRDDPTSSIDAIIKSSAYQPCKRGKVLFDFAGRGADELTVSENDEIAIIIDVDAAYYVARCLRTEREGDIPKSYVEILDHDVWIVAHKMEYAFTAERAGEMTVAKDDSIQVLKPEPGDWWLVKLRSTGNEGWVPASYVSRYDLREARVEYEPEAARVRPWVDRTGGFTTDAAFCGFKDGCVVLHKTNGVVLGVPGDQLSVADLEYLEHEMRRSVTT